MKETVTSISPFPVVQEGEKDVELITRSITRTKSLSMKKSNEVKKSN